MVAAVRAPIEASVTVNGVSLTYFEWGRGSAGDPILLAHATGFHARCWDQVVTSQAKIVGRQDLLFLKREQAEDRL